MLYRKKQALSAKELELDYIYQCLHYSIKIEIADSPTLNRLHYGYLIAPKFILALQHKIAHSS